MPVLFYANNKGTFQNITASSNLGNKKGWWTSIVPGDFDNDGDIDFVVGNLGLNSFFKASEKYPVSIYAKDFDNNRNFDAIPTIYLPTSQVDTTKKEYPAREKLRIEKNFRREKSDNKRLSYFRCTCFKKWKNSNIKK